MRGRSPLGLLMAMASLFKSMSFIIASTIVVDYSHSSIDVWSFECFFLILPSIFSSFYIGREKIESHHYFKKMVIIVLCMFFCRLVS